MSDSHGEVTAFLCGGIPLCVYDCFDVHRKYLREGHQIVMTHQKPGWNRIQENSLRNWRVISIKTSIVPAKYKKQTFKNVWRISVLPGRASLSLCWVGVILSIRAFPWTASITAFCEGMSSTDRLSSLETTSRWDLERGFYLSCVVFRKRILFGVWTRTVMSSYRFVRSVYTLLPFSFSLYPLGKQETGLH